MNYDAERIELKKLFDYYLSLANRRVGWAQSWIADAYYWGWGTEKNFDKFIEWDTKAARNGSLTSSRRMFLYYHSIGSIEAAATLVLSNYKVLPYANGDFRKYSESFSGKGVFEVIDAYDNADIFESGRSEVKCVAAILKSICYIYGFSCETDYQKAMNALLEFDNSFSPDDKDGEMDRAYRYCDNPDFWHYYCCLREIGISGSDSFDSRVYRIMHSDGSYDLYRLNEENESDAYLIRHGIRWALSGNKEFLSKIGLDLRESENKRENSRRRLIYHNDSCAMSYLRLVAGIIPNSTTTCEAIKLTSNPGKNSFDADYAKKLCAKVDSGIDAIEEKDFNYNFKHGLESKFRIRHALIDAYTDLARSEQDTSLKRTYGERGLYQCTKLQEEGHDEPIVSIGKLYYDGFQDYNKALSYFSQGDNDVCNSYAQKCREKIAGVRNQDNTVKVSAQPQYASNYANNAPTNTYSPQVVSVSNPANSGSSTNNNGLSIATLVTGILGLFACSPSMIAAIVLGIIALVKGDRSWMTIVGLVMGGIELIGAFIWLIYFIAH